LLVLFFYIFQLLIIFFFYIRDEWVWLAANNEWTSHFLMHPKYFCYTRNNKKYQETHKTTNQILKLFYDGLSRVRVYQQDNNNMNILLPIFKERRKVIHYDFVACFTFFKGHLKPFSFLTLLCIVIFLLFSLSLSLSLTLLPPWTR
jgi:hypothetical protein